MRKEKKSALPKAEGLEVFIDTNGDKKSHIEAVNDALRQFKKKLKKSELMEELRNREAYMSPSKARRFKTNEAIKQKKRDERKNEWSNKQKFE